MGSCLRALTEGFSAVTEWVGLLPSTGSPVRRQKELSARGFAAAAALAAFLSRVYSLTRCRVTAPDGGLPTVTAFTQLLPSVHPLGYCKARGRAEDLSTLATLRHSSSPG